MFACFVKASFEKTESVASSKQIQILSSQVSRSKTCDNSRHSVIAARGNSAVDIVFASFFISLGVSFVVVAFQVTQENPTKPIEP